MKMSAQSGNTSHFWRCPECPLVSTQRDEESLYRHLVLIHGLKEKEGEMESVVFFAQYVGDLVKKGFSHERYVFRSRASLTPLDEFINGT